MQSEIIATLEQSLAHAKAQKENLEKRLHEIESDAAALRAEIETLDKIATQAEEAIVSLLSTARSSRGSRVRPSIRANENDEIQPHHPNHEDLRQTPIYQSVAPNFRNLPNRQRTEAYPQNRQTDYQEQNYSSNSETNYHQPNYGVSNYPPTNPNYPNNSNAGYNNPNYRSPNTNVVSMHQRNFRHHIPPINTEVQIQNNRFEFATITQACTVLLNEAGKPLHVNELYNRLLEGGFVFTGNNPTISIAVSLTRNRHFRKVAPGTFELNIKDAARYGS